MKHRSFIARHVAELPKSGIRRFFDIVAQRKDVISLGVGEPDFDTPWHISRAAVTCLEDGVVAYKICRSCDKETESMGIVRRPRKSICYFI